MRSASTDERTGAIRTKLKSPYCKAEMLLYINTGGRAFWDQTALVLTCTRTSHGLRVGDTIHVSSTGNVGRVPLGEYTIATVIDDDTFTMPSPASGSSTGTFVYKKWDYIQDLDTKGGINISKSAKRFKYSNYSLTPLASTIKFNIINDQGKYSSGSGSAFEDLLNLDTEVQVRGGYVLADTAGTTSITLQLNPSLLSLTATYLYYTAYNSSGYIEYDSTGASGEAQYYDGTGVYGTAKYGTSIYGSEQYVIFTYDLQDKQYYEITQFTVTANDVCGTVAYRYTDNPDAFPVTLTELTFEGATSAGTSTYTVTHERKRYIQVTVFFELDTLQVSDVTLTRTDYLELVYKENFYLDTPSYPEPKAPEIPSVKCSGRDIYKRALEINVNTDNLSAGVTVDQLIKDMSDKAELPYSSDSIADLSAFAQRRLSGGYNDAVKIDSIFTDLMQILNKTGYNYQMYVEYDSTQDQNILFVQPAPSIASADYVFQYENYVSIGNKRKNYDKLLKRITMFSEKKSPGVEKELASPATYTTIGVKTITGWTGNAEYKRFTVDTGGSSSDISVTLTDVAPTSMEFTIAGSTVNVNIIVYGSTWLGGVGDPTYEEVVPGTRNLNDLSVRGIYEGADTATYLVEITTAAATDIFKWSDNDGVGYTTGVPIVLKTWMDLSNGVQIWWEDITNHVVGDVWRIQATNDNPRYQAEWMNYNNTINNKGITAELRNPLVTTASEAKDVCEGLVDKYGDPDDEAIGINFPYLNLLIEQNDLLLLWTRYTYVDDLYYATGVSYTWNITSDSSKFDANDSGLDYGDIIYDKSWTSDKTIQYDGNVLYDMSYGTTTTESDVDTSKYYKNFGSS